MLAPRFHSCSARAAGRASRLPLRRPRLLGGLITRTNTKGVFHLRIPQVGLPAVVIEMSASFVTASVEEKEGPSPVLLRGLTRATGRSSASAPPRAPCVSHPGSGLLTPSHVLRADTVLAGLSERKRLCTLREADVQSATGTDWCK